MKPLPKTQSTAARTEFQPLPHSTRYKGGNTNIFITNVSYVSVRTLSWKNNKDNDCDWIYVWVFLHDTCILFKKHFLFFFSQPKVKHKVLFCRSNMPERSLLLTLSSFVYYKRYILWPIHSTCQNRKAGQNALKYKLTCDLTWSRTAIKKDILHLKWGVFPQREPVRSLVNGSLTRGYSMHASRYITSY